jgi:oligoribonuclease (3'-5' exoribonuclease)
MTNDRILVLDVETGGLDPKKHALFEVAALVLDKELRPVGSVFSVALKPSLLPSETTDSEAMEMHLRLGRLDRWQKTGTSLTEANRALLEHLVATMGRHANIQVAGFNPSFAMAFVRRWLPDATCCLHHRSIDVLSQRWLMAKLLEKPEWAVRKQACRFGGFEKSLDTPLDVVDDVLAAAAEMRAYAKKEAE